MQTLVVFVLILNYAAFEALASLRPIKPNVLLIISDDYRPEGRLGIDPHPAGPLFDTPNVNGLARQSVVFDSAYSASPSCVSTEVVDLRVNQI